jgi:NhaA family Na+:H+ antiporter
LSDLSQIIPRYADPTNPIGRVFSPFRQFTRTAAAGGILMFGATVAALVWANSPWRDLYFDLWNTSLSLQLGGYGLTKDLSHWINDGLMVVFFFVVGLEIKREMLVGELASPRQAALPIAAAAGGAVVPALIYLAINAGGDAARGWGVPMATDIAFAIGIMALLGNRVPLGLRVFVTALAIVDDLIAVLVIAVFYTESLQLGYLAVGAIIVAALLTANRLDVTKPIVYGILGIALWFVFVKSGVHATIAGVLLALTIPARTLLNAPQFVQAVDNAMSNFRGATDLHDPAALSNHEQQAALMTLETAAERVQSPLQRFEHSLHPWSSFVIVPLFALANAGVDLGGDITEVLFGPVSVGIMLGLLVGKPIGITLMALLTVRMGWSSLPAGVTMLHVIGASCLAGIGFTMSLFIGELAFTNDNLREAAKIGTLAASITAGLLGAGLLIAASRARSRT